MRHADDPSYTDARVPTTHAFSHCVGGPDPLSPAGIGAAAAQHTHDFRDLNGTAAARHTHAAEDLTGVAPSCHRHSHLDLDGVAAERHSHKVEEIAGASAEGHHHQYEDLSGVAAVKHTHVADAIIAGVFAAERIVADLRPGMLLRVSEELKLELVDFNELLFDPETVARLREALMESE